jgi:prevent-host-death family protein
MRSDRQHNMVMKQLSASKFKEQCLALLDRVDPEGIVVTKRGKPVAKLIPFGADSADLIGSLKGKLRIKGEILSTGIKWDAERRHARTALRRRRHAAPT